MTIAEPWWKGGVLYQIYVRSFADSNRDGIGDLAGLTAKLDYLEWLGVDGVWLNPIHPSPNVDWGYDVADYLDVHPDLDTLSDLDALVAEAEARGIRVLLDLVPNHTSDQHPWFRERPEYYVWADEVPNNWRAIFGGGSAWELDGERGRFYLHNFAREQPDLDWWNPDVREEFERILRVWFDRGIAGFRIDVAHALIKDKELRDEPSPEDRVFSMNRPETHQILREWRTLADSYDPPRVLVGEAYVLDVERWARYHGSGYDELNLAFNFGLVHAALDAAEMREIIAATEAVLPKAAWPAGPARITTQAGSRPAGPAATKRVHAARCSCSSRCEEHRFSTTATSSRSRTDTSLRSACAMSPTRHAIHVARRCRGHGTASGTIPGCRSRTRAATSRTSARIGARRCTSRVI